MLQFKSVVYAKKQVDSVINDTDFIVPRKYQPYKDFELGIQYEGRFKKDYQDHTGMINFRYNF